ncbi:baseplate J/gp47 family protein [Aeromonas piscicola]|uniref:baseplate J/gp47 family protein n=1 Tax=Aeromonas piscicola TaxID=600645 RepID=UPI0005B2F000|nr:baseplate J/gp47 family protein [Aeromonas piscicola]
MSSYTPPTLPEIIVQIQADIDSRLSGAESSVRNRVLNAISFAFSGAISGEYDELAWLANQLIPHLSDDAFLLRWAAFFGVPRKQPAVASGSVSVVVASALTIPAGTQWRRADGTLYESNADITASSGGSLLVQAIAQERGALGNCIAGTALTLVSPITGVQPVGSVSFDGMVGGANQEPIEQLRSRLLLRVQYPPQGGTKWDYERWAREVPGVVMAWCFPTWQGPGTVGVTFVLDGEGDAMFPTEADAERVASYIDYHPDPLTGQPVGQPLGPVVTTFISEPLYVDFTIKVSPNTPEVQAQVMLEIATLMGSQGAPDSAIPPSHIRKAIARAAGVDDSELLSPTAYIVTTHNQLAMPGEYTWE